MKTQSEQGSSRLKRGARRWHGVILGAVLLLGHWHCSSYRLPPLSPRVAALPERLSQTGLYRDAELRELADDLREYAPAYELWSDGASKRRWLRLPPGTRIDTSDMNSWVFPVGTQLWKEFSERGRRVETRLLQRVAESEDGWVAVAYGWDEAGTEALARPEGAQDVLETHHDVPGARACMTCHGGRRQRALGFSALQLSHPARSETDWTLERLAREQLLSAPPVAPIQIPGAASEVAALGYLHANCGSCHSRERIGDARFFRPPAQLDLWLRVDELESPAATATYRSAIGEFVIPGAPEESRLFRRFTGSSWFRRRMPPLASEVLDPNGARILARWIDGLAATGSGR
ncbi:MAG: hypothetical protein RL033_7282 [Pseudomonadota bacterium]|jgi:mono/diheme cytochrome c family protein